MATVSTARRPPRRRQSSARPGGGTARTKPTTKPTGTKPGIGRPRRRSADDVEHAQDREPRQITVRTLVLVVVVLLAFALVAPTLGAYVRQQEQHRDLRADLEAAQQRSDELQAAVDRWHDDDYVRNQARNRLGFVMPGETPYRVLDPETITGERAPEESDSGDLTGPVPLAPSGPWYLIVRDSAQVAGQMAEEVEP